MKKILPILFTITLFLIILASPAISFAQTPPNGASTDSRWVIDPEVTFIGKNAARSGDFLNWTLQNYNWVCVQQIANGQCNNTNNPIAKYWSLIVLYIVVPMLFVVILATSMVIIITRGKSLTIMRFIPRFVAVVLLIVFSYSLLQFLYEFTDLIQGFFLRSNINTPCPPGCISDRDLLYVGWSYKGFVGLRLLGDQYAESAFISLLLTKLTALTYFVMVFLLLVRKIILWFFIIVSPIFPILLLYYPVRNTGKIWIGEFFRWLLYAPLFAIFLNGLVYLWRNQIPLVFNNPNIGNAAAIEYPTAVNILLGGPKQVVSPTNSVNLPETFALYVVSLIMLWIVILLPWILLQIFLDYAQSFAPGDTAVMKTLVNLASNRGGGGGPKSPTEGGAAISLPFSKKFSMPIEVKPTPGGPTGAAKELKIDNATVTNANFNQPAFIPTAAINNASVNAQVLNAANVKVPSLRDIAKYDSAFYSRDTSRQQEVSRFSEQLVKIANPANITNTVERERVEKIREKIVTNRDRGNQVASSIMNAASSISRSNIKASNSEIKSVLSQIANPASSSTSSSSLVSHDKLSKLHDTLQKQSKESNSQLASSLMSVNEKTSNSDIEKIRDQLKIAATKGDKSASSVISTINNSQQKSEEAQQTRAMLKQIANPSTVTNTAEREKFTQLHNALQKESSERNNTLASSVLQVSDSTSVRELDKIREQLSQSKESTVIQSVNNMMQQNQTSTHIKSVLQAVANPTTTDVVNREKVNKLHESLEKASSQGNQLASTILKVSDKTTSVEIEALQKRIQDAKLKGEPIATEVSNLAKDTQQASLPSVNRIQTVHKEDYQAVKDMWKQNYQNLEVPQGMSGTRAEWIKDDIGSIDETIGLLSSSDESKVQQGMDQVSNLLPFLLVGGFSKTEIVEYLKAKQDAAKEISTSLATEEEDKLSVSTKATHATQTMSASMTESNDTSSSSSSSGREESESPLSNISTTNISNTTNYSQPEISNEILNMVNVKVPKLQDIAQFETRTLRKDTTKTEELEKVRNVLGNIANPTKITDSSEREKFVKLRESLLMEQQKGNTTANHLLNAANRVEGKPVAHTKSVLSQIANPSLASVETDKKRFSELHDSLTKASQDGNQLATAILATKESTSENDVEDLKAKIQAAKEKGDDVSASVLPDISGDEIPKENAIQQVAQQDYDEVRKLWEENYRNLPVPEEFGSDRNAWITSDTKFVEETIALLDSGNAAKQQEGQKRVSDIMPVLLLGGFSNQEVTGYLKAKLEAGKNVLKEVQKEEEGKVAVSDTVNKEQEEKTLKVDENDKGNS